MSGHKTMIFFRLIDAERMKNWDQQDNGMYAAHPDRCRESHFHIHSKVRSQNLILKCSGACTRKPERGLWCGLPIFTSSLLWRLRTFGGEDLGKSFLLLSLAKCRFKRNVKGYFYCLGGLKCPILEQMCNWTTRIFFKKGDNNDPNWFLKQTIINQKGLQNTWDLYYRVFLFQDSVFWRMWQKKFVALFVVGWLDRITNK